MRDGMRPGYDRFPRAFSRPSHFFGVSYFFSSLGSSFAASSSSASSSASYS